MDATVRTDGVVSIEMGNWEGSGYTDLDVGASVTISPCDEEGCTSAEAEIEAIRNDGRVRSMRVTNGGSGYTSTPRVTIPNPTDANCCAASASASLYAKTGSILTSFSNSGASNSFTPSGLGSGAAGKLVDIDGRTAAVAYKNGVYVLDMNDEDRWAERFSIELLFQVVHHPFLCR